MVPKPELCTVLLLFLVLGITLTFPTNSIPIKRNHLSSSELPRYTRIKRSNTFSNAQEHQSGRVFQVGVPHPASYGNVDGVAKFRSTLAKARGRAHNGNV